MSRKRQYNFMATPSQQSGYCYINNLPREILFEEIFNWILPYDWKAVRLTCRYWMKKWWICSPYRKQHFVHTWIKSLRYQAAQCTCALVRIRNSPMSLKQHNYNIALKVSFVIDPCASHLTVPLEIASSYWGGTKQLEKRNELDWQAGFGSPCRSGSVSLFRWKQYLLYSTVLQTESEAFILWNGKCDLWHIQLTFLDSKGIGPSKLDLKVQSTFAKNMGILSDSDQLRLYDSYATGGKLPKPDHLESRKYLVRWTDSTSCYWL